ncbi:MAG: prenyltransferase [Thermoplasmatales archaeon]|jgi:1,4-dihydroxy-2-naphthoate octaprenyltransferase|nr:prenyltransferase [Thermoplasmatales archaeon]
MENEVLSLLRKGRTMVVSTTGESLWSAKVFYCLEGGLVFLVEKGSLTLKNLQKNDSVVFTIDFDTPDLFIQGVGKVTILGEPREFHKERGTLLYKVPEDTLFVKSGHVLIAKLLPENIRFSDFRAQPKKSDNKFKPEELTEKKTFRYWRALRPWSFQQSVTSLIFGALIAFQVSFSLRISLYLLVLSSIALIMVHGAFNAYSDYFDFTLKTDKPDGMGSAGARVLIDRLIPTDKFLYFTTSIFVIGLAIGIYLIAIRPIILPYVVIGLIAGLIYGIPKLGWKRIALGDLAVFLAFGPGIFLGSLVLQGGHVGIPQLLISFSLGMIIVAILHGNNWRDIKDDREAGVKTIALYLGDKGSLIYYITLIWASYPLFVVAVLLEPRLFPILGALLTIPWAIRLTRIAGNAKNMKRNLLDMLTANFTTLHIYFSVIFLAVFLAVIYFFPSLHFP